MTAKNRDPNAPAGELERADDPAMPLSKWEDPSVPVGNAPPMPRWPLAALTLAWAGWVVFLIVMMITVRQSRGG